MSDSRERPRPEDGPDESQDGRDDQVQLTEPVGEVRPVGQERITGRTPDAAPDESEERSTGVRTDETGPDPT